MIEILPSQLLITSRQQNIFCLYKKKILWLKVLLKDGLKSFIKKGPRTCSGIENIYRIQYIV